MGQEELIKTLIEENLRETRRIVEQAEAEAERLTAEARAEAQRHRSDRLATLKTELDKTRATQFNRARTSSTGMLLKVKSEIIEDLLEEAAQRFEALPGDEYAVYLNAFYEELSGDWKGVAGCSGPEVHVNPGDVGHIKDPSANIVADPGVALGAVFTTSDGKIRAENTFRSRLDRGRRELMPRLKEILFK